MQAATARLAPALLLVTVSACLGGRLPPLELYRLAVPDSARMATALDQPSLRLPLPSGSVAVAPYVAPGIYGNRNIVYRIGDTEYGSYPSREWSMPLATMLGLFTEDILRRQPIARDGALFDPPSYATQRYVWRGTVREFEEVDRGKRVSAVAELDVRLTRAADDSVLWSGSARVERQVPEATMSAIATALSYAAAEAITTLADQARASLLHAASADRSPD